MRALGGTLRLPAACAEPSDLVALLKPALKPPLPLCSLHVSLLRVLVHDGHADGLWPAGGAADAGESRGTGVEGGGGGGGGGVDAGGGGEGHGDALVPPPRRVTPEEVTEANWPVLVRVKVRVS